MCRVHVSRVMCDLTYDGQAAYLSYTTRVTVMVNQCYVVLSELVNYLYLNCTMASVCLEYILCILHLLHSQALEVQLR